MFTICLKEFNSLFKSIRSIIIICTVLGVTVGAAKLISTFEAQLEGFGLGDNAYAGGLLVLLFLAGPLFVTSLSHNIVNKEVDSRTIRFIATKTSRENVIVGKFMGIILFWSLCLFIALVLVIPFSKSFYFLELIQSIIFISYFVGFTLLLSTIINRPSMTMFIGIMIAVVLPVLGLWSIGSENLIITIISYITPYFYYSQEKTFYTYFVAFFPLLFVVLSLLIMRKKDL